MNQISETHPEPLYRQVETYIESLIRSRRLSPGSRLPSLVELTEQLGVSPITVRRSIRELADRGVVVTRQGRGVFVAEAGRPRVAWVSGLDLFSDELSPFFGQMLRETAPLLRNRGYDVEPVWLPNRDTEQTRQWLQTHRIENYAGFVFLGCLHIHPLYQRIVDTPRPRADIITSPHPGPRSVSPDIAEADRLDLVAPSNFILSDDITLIENDSADPLDAEFVGLSEGTVFNLGRYFGRISYVGGDGNDLVIQAVPEPGVATLLLLGAAGVLQRRRRNGQME